ncbi:hypothetical protein BDI4_930020 [Burkholderia diffusa]|nr:hypothetical protein BDI4_930020 [Burkholderia diffusa]
MRAPPRPAALRPRRASKWRNPAFRQPVGPAERFTMTAVPRRESSCALSFTSAARLRWPPPCWRPPHTPIT